MQSAALADIVGGGKTDFKNLINMERTSLLGRGKFCVCEAVANYVIGMKVALPSLI